MIYNINVRILAFSEHLHGTSECPFTVVLKLDQDSKPRQDDVSNFLRPVDREGCGVGVCFQGDGEMIRVAKEEK
jgi:hypothetical protein